MRKLLFFVFPLLALLVLVGSAVAAFASSPHFISASASGPDGAGNLTVSFKEAGLDDNALINYLASAQASAVYACINGGGNHPQAANKETVSGPDTASGAFASDKNGNVTASLLLAPLSPGSFTCPPGQALVLADVGYSNLAVTDVTNGVSQPIDGSFSQTFYTL